MAVVLTLSLSAVAFAKEVEAENTTAGTTVDNDEDKKYELGFGDLGGEEDATPISPALSTITPSWMKTTIPAC